MAALVAVLLLPGGLAAMCGEPDAAGRSIAHYHQHKNAGITIRAMLKNVTHAREMHSSRPPLAEVLRAAGAKREFVVTFVREPVSRTLSRYWYWRATGSDKSKKTRKARCATLLEYARASARANNQHQYMLGGAALGACASRRRLGGRARGFSLQKLRGFSWGARGRSNKGPAEGDGVFDAEAGNRTKAPADVCPAGAEAYGRRVDELLASPDLFVGVVEHFDLSLLLLGRLFPDLDVDYCRRNSVVGAPRLDAVRASAADAVRVIAAKNRLDAVVHRRAEAALLARARCVFGGAGGVDRALANYTARLRAFQRERCGTSGHSHSLGSPLDEPTAWSPSEECRRYRASEDFLPVSDDDEESVDP